MEIGIVELAQQQAQWLMERHRVIANNVAHVASPGYRAVDLKPFSETLERTNLTMRSTNATHLRSTEFETHRIGKRYLSAIETSHSGNTVSLDQQMLAENEVRQGYALNSSIVKAWHRIVLSATKG